jgi:hypothetical protein
MMTNLVNGSLATHLLRIGMAVIVMGLLISCVAAERRGATAQNGSDSGPTSSDQEQAIQLLNTRCAMCHSTDLITQQRLGESKWRAEIEKMIRWGAYLSSPEQDILVSYLASRFHPDLPDTIQEEGQGEQRKSWTPPQGQAARR